MNRRVLNKLLPVLVVVAGGLGAVATVATSEAKPADPIFTKPVESVRTVTPPAQPSGTTSDGGTTVAPPAPTETTRPPKPQPNVIPSGGGGCPDCLEEPLVAAG